MTDVTDSAPRGPLARPSGAGHPDHGDETAAAQRERLLACVELLFFAYRDFTRDPDAVLDRFGFGRAHHRVIHFVHRNPGLRVADLLVLLNITKQSLARVLKQLIDEGFILQRAGKADRRERLLFVTAKGARLADQLATIQTARIEEAMGAVGPEGEDAVLTFLFSMISKEERARVEALFHARSSAARRDSRTGRS